MNRESKIVLVLAVVVIAIVTVTFGARSSRASVDAAHVHAEMPHALAHVKSVADLFPPGR